MPDDDHAIFSDLVEGATSGRRAIFCVREAAGGDPMTSIAVVSLQPIAYQLLYHLRRRRIVLL